MTRRSWIQHIFYANLNENKNTSDYFNPTVSQMGGNNSQFNQGATKEDYQKYGWLFGAR